MWKWYCLAGVLGGFAVLAWGVEQRPLWRSHANAGRLEGFSPDDRVLVSSEIPAPENNRWPDPVVSRFDAQTGKLLSRANMACVHPFRLKAVRPSADGRIALVGEGFPPDPTRTDLGTGEWFLHDGVTGERYAGPIAGMVMAFGEPFSPDNRWFVGACGELGGGWDKLAGIDIFSAATGEKVVSLADHDGRRTRACHFSPDGATAAVDWQLIGADINVPLTVQIIDLPSGRERRRVVLPPKANSRRWDGRYLRAVSYEPHGDEAVFRAYTLDLAQDRLDFKTAKPWLTMRTGKKGEPNGWIEGRDWLAYLTFVPHDEPSTPGWWDKLMERLALRSVPFPGPRATLRFVDRSTGETRYETPRPLGLTCLVSEDGRLLAGAGDNRTIEVWRTDPWPRWPSAVLVGAVVAAGVLMIGQLRQKGSPHPTREAISSRGA